MVFRILLGIAALFAQGAELPKAGAVAKPRAVFPSSTLQAGGLAPAALPTLSPLPLPAGLEAPLIPAGAEASPTSALTGAVEILEPLGEDSSRDMPQEEIGSRAAQPWDGPAGSFASETVTIAAPASAAGGQLSAASPNLAALKARRPAPLERFKGASVPFRALWDIPRFVYLVFGKAFAGSRTTVLRAVARGEDKLGTIARVVRMGPELARLREELARPEGWVKPPEEKSETVIQALLRRPDAEALLPHLNALAPRIYRLGGGEGAPFLSILRRPDAVLVAERLAGLASELPSDLLAWHDGHHLKEVLVRPEAAETFLELRRLVARLQRGPQALSTRTLGHLLSYLYAQEDALELARGTADAQGAAFESLTASLVEKAWLASRFYSTDGRGQALDRPDVLSLEASRAASPAINEEVKAGMLEALAQILELYPDRDLYFLGRDAEYFYDLARVLLRGTPDFERIRMVNISQKSVGRDGMFNYLRQEGLRIRDLLLGRRALIVDTGFEGGVYKALLEHLPEEARASVGIKLMASKRPQLASTRVFLRTLDKNAAAKPPMLMEDAIYDLEDWKFAHYGPRATHYELFDGRWMPARLDKLDDNDKSEGSPERAVATMRDVRAYGEDPAVLRLFARRRAFWRRLRGLRDPRAVRDALIRVLRVPDRGEAIVRDYLEFLDLNEPSLRLAPEEVGLDPLTLDPSHKDRVDQARMYFLERLSEAWY